MSSKLNRTSIVRAQRGKEQSVPETATRFTGESEIDDAVPKRCGVKTECWGGRPRNTQTRSGNPVSGEVAKKTTGFVAEETDFRAVVLLSDVAGLLELRASCYMSGSPCPAAFEYIPEILKGAEGVGSTANYRMLNETPAAPKKSVTLHLLFGAAPPPLPFDRQDNQSGRSAIDKPMQDLLWSR
jgi:hypothetical protein